MNTSEFNDETVEYNGICPVYLFLTPFMFALFGVVVTRVRHQRWRPLFDANTKKFRIHRHHTQKWEKDNKNTSEGTFACTEFRVIENNSNYILCTTIHFHIKYYTKTQAIGKSVANINNSSTTIVTNNNTKWIENGWEK